MQEEEFKAAYAKLDQLKKDGFVSSEEYETRRKVLLDNYLGNNSAAAGAAPASAPAVAPKPATPVSTPAAKPAPSVRPPAASTAGPKPAAKGTPEGLEPDTSLPLKVIVVGEPGVGKTCVILRYVHNTFNPNMKKTIGVDFFIKSLRVNNSDICLQLWDIAGQERFQQMTRVYYTAAVGAVVVCDLSRPATLDLAQRWKQDIDNKVQLFDGSPIPCILLANKCDMAPVTPERKAELDKFAQENGFLQWFETSALKPMKEGNIDKSFSHLVQVIVGNEAAMPREPTGGIKIHRPPRKEPTKSDCSC